MVCSAQTVHLSCVKISTISKQTEMSFHLSLITSKHHQVHLKRFLSLQYVRRKPCMYLASRLALSLNGQKRASTWASSSSNSIRCIKNNFLAGGLFTKPVHQSCTYTNTVSIRTEIRFEFHPMRPKQFLRLWYVRCKLCTYLASRLALSLNGLKRVSTWASSSSNSIGCIKNYFLAHGMFTESVHISRTYTNTVSKRTEMRFEFHPVLPKQFVSLWYVRRKPCTYLASRSALSENGPKWDSTWPTSPGNFIECV
jgi:hypothetical protein